MMIQDSMVSVKALWRCLILSLIQKHSREKEHGAHQNSLGNKNNPSKKLLQGTSIMKSSFQLIIGNIRFSEMDP